MNNKPVFKVTKRDFELTWFSGTGSGGQHRNRHMNCCRIRHRDTGIIKTGQSHRDQQANRREALTALANDPRFKAYCSMKLRELETGKTVEQQVDEMLHPSNLKIEIEHDGKWISEHEYKQNNNTTEN